jgi:L-threonylcarbamoyladenylate synthase
MPTITVDRIHPDRGTIERAAAILRGGGLVAFPTETVYGLGAHALDPVAVGRIYAAKGRPAYNPIIVHVADRSQVSSVARDWNDAAERLAQTFWPGPLTMVLPRRPEVPNAVTAGLDTVGIRIPNHPVAQALLAAAAIPIAAPSANRSMAVSPTTGAHVAKSLGDAVDLILDAGPTTVGIESTVIDLSRTPPVLLRPGSISVPELEAAVGPIAFATHGALATGTPAQAQAAPRPSPGMLDKHYSPRAKLVLEDAAHIAEQIAAARRAGQRVGLLVTSEDIEIAAGTAVRLPASAAGFAAGLYGALHALDDAGVDLIIVERPPDAAEWLGVRDRLERAAR